MSTIEIVAIAIAAGILEFIISFFFNYKIFWITKENFVLAGIYGATATFLYMIMSSFIVYFSAQSENVWIIIISAVIIAIGNFLSTIAIKRVQAYIENRKQRNMVETVIKEEKLVAELNDDYISIHQTTEIRIQKSFLDPIDWSNFDIEPNETYYLKVDDFDN